MFDVATCPLCSAPFDDAEPYRDHLEEAHGLRDDEGTATVTQLRAPSAIEDEAAMSLVAEAVLDTAPAAGATGPEAEPEAPPEAPPTPGPADRHPPAPPTTPSTQGPRSGLRWGTGRYPLATQHGDVALYLPGLLLLLTALVRLEADVLGIAFLVLGAAMVVLGMLLPLVLGRR